MNNLVIIGHPDKNSFCHNGIFKTIIDTFSKHQSQNVKIVDLYGREVNTIKENQLLFYLYDDGTIEKQISIR